MENFPVVIAHHTNRAEIRDQAQHFIGLGSCHDDIPEANHLVPRGFILKNGLKGRKVGVNVREDEAFHHHVKLFQMKA